MNTLVRVAIGASVAGMLLSFYALTQNLVLLLNAAGISSEVIGLAIAAISLDRQNKEHDGQPLWRWYALGQAWARGLFRRRRVVHAVDLDGAMAVDSALSLRWMTSSPTIPEDATVEEQVRLLVQRTANLERLIESNHRSHDEAIADIRRDSNALRDEFRAADESLRAKIKESATGGLQLEVKSLLWIGFGAVITAIAAIIQIATSA